MTRILILLAVTSVTLFAQPMIHFRGAWGITERDIKVQIEGIDQEGVVVVPEILTPTKIIINDSGKRVIVKFDLGGKPVVMKILHSSPNEIIVAHPSFGTEQTPNRFSEAKYHFPHIYRIAYRTRFLEVICITDNKLYRVLARKETESKKTEQGGASDR